MTHRDFCPFEWNPVGVSWEFGNVLLKPITSNTLMNPDSLRTRFSGFHVYLVGAPGPLQRSFGMNPLQNNQEPEKGPMKTGICLELGLGTSITLEGACLGFAQVRG